MRCRARACRRERCRTRSPLRSAHPTRRAPARRGATPRIPDPPCSPCARPSRGYRRAASRRSEEPDLLDRHSSGSEESPARRPRSARAAMSSDTSRTRPQSHGIVRSHRRLGSAEVMRNLARRTARSCRRRSSCRGVAPARVEHLARRGTRDVAVPALSRSRAASIPSIGTCRAARCRAGPRT